MHLQRSNGWLAALAMAAVALAPLAITTPAARADVFTFSTPTGSMAGGQPVSATATFTVTAGTISITLQNLQANPTSVIQALSDLDFTVGGGSLTSSSLTTSSGQEITVNDNTPGGFTLGSTVPTGWPYSSTATVGTLNDLAAGGAGPTHLIIGPPDASNAYSNANGSIAGNSSHNPFLNQSATFTIGGAGILASTAITAVTFSFGTTSGTDVTGVLVPEPSALAIAGLGALGFIGYGLRRRLKK
jgi:hypothetical protein